MARQQLTDSRHESKQGLQGTNKPAIGRFRVYGLGARTWRPHPVRSVFAGGNHTAFKSSGKRLPQTVHMLVFTSPAHSRKLRREPIEAYDLLMDAGSGPFSLFLWSELRRLLLEEYRGMMGNGSL